MSASLRRLIVLLQPESVTKHCFNKVAEDFPVFKNSAILNKKELCSQNPLLPCRNSKEISIKKANVEIDEILPFNVNDLLEERNKIFVNNNQTLKHLIKYFDHNIRNKPKKNKRKPDTFLCQSRKFGLSSSQNKHTIPLFQNDKLGQSSSFGLQQRQIHRDVQSANETRTLSTKCNVLSLNKKISRKNCYNCRYFGEYGKKIRLLQSTKRQEIKHNAAIQGKIHKLITEYFHSSGGNQSSLWKESMSKISNLLKLLVTQMNKKLTPNKENGDSRKNDVFNSPVKFKRYYTKPIERLYSETNPYKKLPKIKNTKHLKVSGSIPWINKYSAKAHPKTDLTSTKYTSNFFKELKVLCELIKNKNNEIGNTVSASSKKTDNYNKDSLKNTDIKKVDNKTKKQNKQEQQKIKIPMLTDFKKDLKQPTSNLTALKQKYLNKYQHFKNRKRPCNALETKEEFLKRINTPVTMPKHFTVNTGNIETVFREMRKSKITEYEVGFKYHEHCRENTKEAK